MLMICEGVKSFNSMTVVSLKNQIRLAVEKTVEKAECKKTYIFVKFIAEWNCIWRQISTRTRYPPIREIVPLHKIHQPSARPLKVLSIIGTDLLLFICWLVRDRVNYIVKYLSMIPNSIPRYTSSFTSQLENPIFELAFHRYAKWFVVCRSNSEIWSFLGVF